MLFYQTTTLGVTLWITCGWNMDNLLFWLIHKTIHSLIHKK